VGSDATSVAGITSTAMEEAASRDGVGVAAAEEEDEAASVAGIGATAAEEEVASVAGVGVAEEEVEEEAPWTAAEPGSRARGALISFFLLPPLIPSSSSSKFSPSFFFLHKICRGGLGGLPWKPRW